MKKMEEEEAVVEEEVAEEAEVVEEDLIEIEEKVDHLMEEEEVSAVMFKIKKLPCKKADFIIDYYVSFVNFIFLQTIFILFFIF